jgi:hypothetical protein
MNPMMSNMIMQIKQNPAQFITQKGFNVPQNINDPNSIIQHLMNTGQVSQAQYNRAMSMINQFRR